MYFYLTDDLVILILTGICALCILLTWLIYSLRVTRVAKFEEDSSLRRPEKPDSEYLPASVIVYSQGDADNLAELLPVLLRQDYPAPYEIIVVNEGESADIRDAVSALRSVHHNLYLTFTPDGVRNLSRKKLAITLGVKAARYKTVVLTTSAAMVESELWLRRMMRQFCNGSPVEIVLGYAYIDPSEDNAHGCRQRAFDHVADSARWIGTALAGHPFRGTEYNLAYTKDVFLRNSGFARSLNLHYGDDDIFISEIANGRNTAVELSRESAVRLRYGNHPRNFSERVLRHCFTESRISRRPRILFPMSGWLQFIALGTGIASGILAYPNLLPATVAAALLIALTVMDMLIWRQAMSALRSRKMLFSLPWLAATYPARRMWHRLRTRIGRQKRYTWT